MDDIICPECGRPNLFEAEKCWYCQTNLQEVKQSDMKCISDDKSEEVLDFSTHTDPLNNEESEQNIPEWLKRVRELKEADSPHEEDDPGWQQQDLFVLDEKSQNNNRTEKKKTINKSLGAQKDKNIQQKNDNPVEFSETNQSQNELDQEISEYPEDLPDGFTKL